LKAMRLTTLVLLLLGIVGSLEAGKKPFAIEDLYRLKTLSGLTLSPDGKEALFVVGSSDLERGEHFSDLYRLNLVDRTLSRLTFSEASESAPAWSRDGKQIYFLSTREDGNQLWRMAATGGEAEKVSDFSPGLSAPLILPDRGAVMFSSHVFPECGADSEANEEYRKKLEEGPTQGHYGKELLFRHWDSYRDWRYSHLLELNLETGDVKSLTVGKRDHPCYRGNFVVSPDEKEICITLNFDPDLAVSTNSDLCLIDIETGARKYITEKNPAFDGDPAYSPNGRYIAYRLQKIPSYESDRFRLGLHDRETGTSKILTDSIDNWVTEFKWSPDSKWIYFKIYELGNLPIYRINIESGKIEKVLVAEGIHEFEITPDGRDLIFIRTSIGDPHEVWQYRINSQAKPRQLTFINKEVVDEVDIRPAESIWIDGAEGKKFQCFLVKPHGFDPEKSYPLILNVHGGPQYQWTDSFRGDWQVYPGSGYVLAFPNPHGSTGFGQEYTAAISRDYDGKVMRDVEKATDYLASLPYVDGNRMGAMGWSWGGYAMMWLEGHTERFKALVCMMGIFDLASKYLSTEELWFPEWDNGGTPWDNRDYYERASPSNYIQNFKTPCLIITGEKDYRVPYTQSLQFFTALKKMNVPSEILIFSNDGHWPDPVKSMPVYYNAHLDWFHRYLGGEKPPYDTEKMLRNLQFD